MHARGAGPRSRWRRLAAWGAGVVALATAEPSLLAQLPNPLPALLPPSGRPATALDALTNTTAESNLPVPVPVDPPPMSIDLPTALQLANASNPTILLARERVQQAYARLQFARAVPLPDLRIAPIVYGRHDGQFQQFDGPIITSSYGNIANNASLIMSFDTSAAVYLPRIARRQVEAVSEAARATTLGQQLEVALAYLDLLSVYGQLAINAETLANAEHMLRNAESAALAGKSMTSSDVQRALTEVEVRRQERIVLEGDVGIRSARLAELLLLSPTADLRPTDPAVIPITLVPLDKDLDELVTVALLNRPELGESRAQREAAVQALQQARAKPLTPQVNVAYTGGGYGGGRNSFIGDYSGRGDGEASLVWNFDNLGFGNAALIREQRSLVTQAGYRILQVQAQVGREVSQAAKSARARVRTLTSAQNAVRQGIEMWRRLSEGAFGMVGGKYNPIDPLIAEQQLAQARNLYLTEVIEYNKAQFRLFTALGQPPLDALDRAGPEPTEIPIEPLGTGPTPLRR